MVATEKPYRILMIDDNPADIRLMLEAIREVALDEIVTPSYAYDGYEALSMLETSKQDGNRYHMILLDLNMPKLHGKEVLAKIKADEELNMIPVIILTNSDYRMDMAECYRNGANAFIQKPSDFKRLTDFFSSVKRSLVINHRLSVLQVERTYEELAVA